MPIYKMEAYWSVGGVLWHGTIECDASTQAAAENISRMARTTPPDILDQGLACDNRVDYPVDYYDIVHLEEQNPSS